MKEFRHLWQSVDQSLLVELVLPGMNEKGDQVMVAKFQRGTVDER